MEQKKKFFKKGIAQQQQYQQQQQPKCSPGGVDIGSIKSGSVCTTRSCTPSSIISDNVFLPPTPASGKNSINNSSSATQSTSNRPRRPTTSTTSNNSSSLDEAENRMTHDRRFVTAPRRARSAERFDGIRVQALSNSSGLERDELLSRNFHLLQQQQQQHQQQPFTRNGFFIPRSSDSLASVPKAMSSPPPPYTPTISDKSLNGAPPSYKQAVAMSMAKENAKILNEQRYKLNNHHRGAQSFETVPGLIRPGLRSATSVPTFKNFAGSACSCSKCQIQERQNMSSSEIGCGDCNDAVYMESQAFLMHEIMTDGMAFCTIM